jgi:protein-S-isoprenylcysteine O-methyltransferase Ste14
MIATPRIELFVLTNLSGVFLALGLYQLYRQLFVEAGRRYEEGLVKTIQMAIGVPALIALALLLADTDLLNKFAIPLNREVLASGIIILNASALIVLWSHRVLGRHWSGDLETKEGHRVIRTGPYRWIRHPQYSSYFLISLGMFLMTGNWLVSALVLSYFSAVAARSWKEEEMLLDRLGRSYAFYCARTGRFLPKMTLGRPRVRDQA